MFCLITILTCLLGSIVSATNSPVIVWGDDIAIPAIPALHTVSQSEFSNIVTPLLKNHMIIAFQENGLSADNLRCNVASTKQSCYPFLRNIASKTYYSNVENPATTIRQISPAVEFNTVGVTGELEEAISCSTEKTIFINFAESHSQISNVGSHDAAIESISKDISCPVVFMFLRSSDTNTKLNSRSRRATAASDGGYVFRATNQLLLFFTNLHFIENGVSQELIITDMTVTTVSNTKLSVTLNSANKPVTFDVFNSAGYYNMSNLQYNNIEFLSNNVYAPVTFSYYCGNLTVPAKTALSTYQLKWNSFQIQAPFGSTTNETFVFSNSWDCVGFVTPGILMGLFIVALFLLITFVGICWIMDINTMDRFDDPKGKTITINAGE